MAGLGGQSYVKRQNIKKLLMKIVVGGVLRHEGLCAQGCELKVKQNKIELVSHFVHPLHTFLKKP